MTQHWIWALAAIAGTGFAAEAARVIAPEPHRLPGNCDKGVVLLCADPSWPAPAAPVTEELPPQ